MDGLELMWAIVDWLPLLFALDLVLFHLVGDHPLALTWWWRRSPTGSAHVARVQASRGRCGKNR